MPPRWRIRRAHFQIEDVVARAATAAEALGAARIASQPLVVDQDRHHGLEHLDRDAADIAGELVQCSPSLVVRAPTPPITKVRSEKAWPSGCGPDR